METPDFFRSRIDAMINLNDPLAVLARRLPWEQIESVLAAKFEREERAGQSLDVADMFGTTAVVVGAGTSTGGRPKLSIRLMASLIFLKHSFNLSDEEVCSRWSENVLLQASPLVASHRAPQRSAICKCGSNVPSAFARSSATTRTSSTRCMPRRSNASAKAMPASLTNSA